MSHPVNVAEIRKIIEIILKNTSIMKVIKGIICLYILICLDVAMK